MKKKELIDILNTQIAKENEFIKTMENDKNPQIVAMVNQSIGKINAFQDILYYAHHNNTAIFKEV